MRRPLATAAALIATLGLARGASARDKLHLWVDSNGVAHLEDDLPGYSSRPAKSRAAKSRRKAQAARAAPAPAPARWWERSTDAPPAQIDFAAALYKIPTELIRAVIAVESAGDTAAVSRTGAKGLMQLMPQTAGHVFVSDPVDPVQNIQGGTRYLRELANEFNGDMVLMLAAYNAGPEAVRKYGGVPPYSETRNYVRRVIEHYNELKQVSAQQREVASAAPTPLTSAAPEQTPPRAP